MRAAAPPAATPAAPGVAHIFQCLDFIHVINEAGKRPVPGWEEGCSRPTRGRGSRGPGQLPGSPPSGGGLGARSTGRGVSDAPGSLQACTGWSSPWRPCRRREEAESLGAAQGGEGGAGGSGLPRAWVQQASLAGSRDQAAGDGGPVSQAAPGKKSGAPGVLGMG